MMTLSTSTSANELRVIFFKKKKRRDFIGAKHTPGCVFPVFLKRKRWHRYVLGRDGRNTKAYALRSGCAKIMRSRKIVQVCCSRAFLLSPVFFASVYIFFTGESSAVFFLLLLFLLIYAVFLCPFCSVYCTDNAGVLVFVDIKHNCLILIFSHCVFLVRIFFRTFNLTSHFLLCCCVALLLCF